MSRWAMGLEYDGHAFQGWQTQPHGQTVQDVLERAISWIADQRVSVTAAGRTDAGVHATSQIVHFDTSVERPADAWVRGVNSGLPDAVAVCWAQPVSDHFHARFSATGRRYRYILLNRPQRPGLWHGRTGWDHCPLDVERMEAAANHLLGEHDFSAFRAAECQARSPVRTVIKASVSRKGDWVLFDFAANAFLHHMVRNLVGSLVYVGRGRKPVDWLAELIEARDRHAAAPTFSAAGLYLAGVDYEERFGLPKTTRLPAPPAEGSF